MNWMVSFECVHRVVIILIILLGTGCAGVQTPPHIIFQDSTYLVRLDLDRSIGGTDDPDRHSHPLDIGNNQITTILNSTRIQEHRALLQRAISGPAEQVRAFSEHDVMVIAPQVRKAFLEATPQQHVVFAIINPVGKRHEITAGEMFIKHNTLHLILNCYQSIDAGTSLSSLCGAIRQQEYDLNFSEKAYFVGFGSEFFGLGKKEIIIDYASIPSSTTPLTAPVSQEPEPMQ